MKTSITTILVLFISLSSFGINNNIAFLQPETLVGTFKGVSEDDKFKFMDAKGTIIIFDGVGEKVEVDLYEEELVGKKFSITWEISKEDVYDDEGEPTGKKIDIKTITGLKKQ